MHTSRDSIPPLRYSIHLGNAPSSDRDRVVPFFERPKGRLGLSDRENYETANTLGFRIGQGTGAIRRLVRRRRDDATAPSRFGKRPRPGCPHRRGSRARVLLVASHDELAPSLSLAQLAPVPFVLPRILTYLYHIPVLKTYIQPPSGVALFLREAIRHAGSLRLSRPYIVARAMACTTQ